MSKCKNCTCENGIKRCVKNGVVSEEVLSGWVSVGDRLPDMKKPVLVYSPNEPDLFSVALLVADNGIRLSWLTSCRGVPNKVTHWMPLPEPPKY